MADPGFLEGDAGVTSLPSLLRPILCHEVAPPLYRKPYFLAVNQPPPLSESPGVSFL